MLLDIAFSLTCLAWQ